MNLDIALFQRFRPQWAYVTMTECVFVCVCVWVGMWEQINLQTTPHHWERINLHTTPHHISFQKMFFRVKTMTDIHREIVYSSIVSDIKDLSVKEKGEGNRDRERGTVFTLHTWETWLLQYIPDMTLNIDTEQKTCWKCTIKWVINTIFCNTGFNKAAWNIGLNYSPIL